MGLIQNFRNRSCSMMVLTSRHALVLGLALLALQAQAAVSTVPIPSRDVQELIQLPDGLLAVSGSTQEWPLDEQTGQLTGSSVYHRFVHVIDPLGKARKDIEVGVPGEGTLVPYRKGFVVWGRNAATLEVHYFPVGPLARESVLHSADGLQYLYLTAPPAGDSLYVAESLSRGGMRLIRFNSSGLPVWTKSYDEAPTGVTAVNDGVVFVRAGPQANHRPRVLLTKLGLDGEEAWSSPTAYAVGGVPIVRFHSQNVIAVASAAADESLDLLNYDSATGRQISHSRFPGYAKLVGTTDGLLLIHSYLYRPYVAMLNSGGSVRWWRRYTPTQSVGVPVTGSISQAGQLVLLTQTADQYEVPANNVVFMQANGQELSNGLNDCTRRDPLPVLEAEQLLRSQYGVDVLLDDSLIVPRPRKSGCPHPTEDEYASAVSAFADVFVNRGETKHPWVERVHVRIMGSGPAMQLVFYNLGMGPTDSAANQMTFEVRYDNAKSFSSYLRETVFPHMSRVLAAQLRFTELTRQVYGAHMPPGEISDPDEFFAQMESATQVLEAKVRARSSSYSWPRRWVGAILYPTKFGGSLEKMQPLDVADQTLIELIEEAAARDGRR